MDDSTPEPVDDPASVIERYRAEPRPSPMRRALAGQAGARWALRELRGFRAVARAEGLNATIAPPPILSRGSLAGALLALRARKATCLERSLIVQRWWATRGVELDVIVGVRLPSADPNAAEAHAWVEYFETDCSDRYGEIRRVPAPGDTKSATSSR